MVKTKLKRKEKRFITGYGPQEDWSDELKAPFFCPKYKNNEAISRKQISIHSNRLNCKLSPNYIPQDPNKVFKNCEILSDILDRNALIVVNGLIGKCEGVIIRQISTADGRIEKSAIHLVIVSTDLEGNSLIV